jgi:hypothetical protein
MPNRIAMDFNDVSISPKAAAQHQNVIMFPCYDDVKIVDKEGKVVFEGSFVMANVHSVVIVTGAEYSDLRRLRAQEGEVKEVAKPAYPSPTF